METVSLCVIAFNEEMNIDKLFNGIKKQTYPHELIEIILVDGKSTDKTKELMLSFKEENLDFKNIMILNNEKRIQPCGLNIAIKNSSESLIIRVDAHSIIPNDFIEKNVKCIESGENICGGFIIKIIDNLSSKLLLVAENSMFGSGFAAYRIGTEKKYVKTVANACYRKEIFEKVGYFNEKLIRSEDNEMHYRINKNGYKICFDENIYSEYLTRPKLKSMLKQKYGNGKYVGITTKISPKIFSLYHYVPFLLVFFAIICFLSFCLSFFNNNIFLRIPFYIGLIVYFTVDLFLAIMESVKNKKKKYIFGLLILYPLLHFSYGFGTIIGFLEMPFKDIRIK